MPRGAQLPDINWVDNFTDAFSASDDGCDGHGLTSHCRLELRDELDCAHTPEHVAVRGKHSWDYCYTFDVSKAKLERARDALFRNPNFDEDGAKARAEDWYSPVNYIQRVSGTILSDSRASPHGQSVGEDYAVTIEAREEDTRVVASIRWTPTERAAEPNANTAQTQ